jgi:hypothetical protein
MIRSSVTISLLSTNEQCHYTFWEPMLQIVKYWDSK